jgi:outer membrane protein OmpA-like peptidoglycan-associated protein
MVLFAGAAAMATAAALPARADPAYTADKLIAIFGKDKERKVCFETEPNCRPSDSPTRVDLYVNFEFDSDKLTAHATENLAQFATALKDSRLDRTKFEIDGFTDAKGADKYNYGLSERRAAAVVSYLVAQGVDPDRLTAKGFGKTRPRAPDPFSAENRRVETHLAK